MKVKIKKLHPNAVIPTYAKHGDAGMDLVAISSSLNKEFLYMEYKTGLAIEIPEGYVGLIFPRSSISTVRHSLANSVGVIDSGYRGEITVRFKSDGNIAGKFISKMLRDSAPFLSKEFEEYNPSRYEDGDKVAQLIILPYPSIEFEEVEDLSETDRGINGFGSTGN